MARVAMSLLIASVSAGAVAAFAPGGASFGVMSRSVSSRAASSCALQGSSTSFGRAGAARGLSLNMQAAALGKKSTAKEVLTFFNIDLTGKTAIVTGANSGIGLETSKALASVGCRVVMAVRNVEAGSMHCLYDSKIVMC